MQMLVEIVVNGDNQIKGLLHNHFMSSPYEFDNLVQMILKMDEVFDSKHFPESFTSPRVFGIHTHDEKDKDTNESVITHDTAESVRRSESCFSKYTFEITVMFRQHATWQGQILWLEKNLRQNFRSVLELLKLIDEAFSESCARQARVTRH